MRDAGYKFINIDDCWSIENATRDANGALQPDPLRFPNGIKAIADYVHSLDLKLGIYGDRGSETCGPPRRLGGTRDDGRRDVRVVGRRLSEVRQLPRPGRRPRTEDQAAVPGDARRAGHGGPPIVYSICAWSFYEWANTMGNLQRTTSDIKNEWPSIVANINSNQAVAAYAGPNHWNDPDMLEVGNSDNGAGLVTDVENQSHFACGRSPARR
jgi:alpha-galactosidase